MSLPGSPGFYGKLPSRGDFVNRRLPAEFTSPWDAWLQQGLARSQSELGGQWLDVYLTSPIWRFALQSGVCGEHAYLGVLVPSVDRVGRYFPLTTAVACPVALALPELAARLEPWFVSVEELMLETLADAPLDLEDFDRQLAEVTLDDAVLRGAAGSAAATARLDAAVCWQADVPAGTPIARPMSTIASALAGSVLRGYAFWWTQGSERVAPCVAVSSELPAAQPFTALLDGHWEPHGWHSFQAPAAGSSASTGGLAYASAAVTDPGSRPINEDSFARGDEQGLWVVADGLGGHRAGDVASRMVTSIVRAQRAGADLERRVEDVAQAIQVVNGCLQELAPESGSGDLVGSTVAALLLGEGRAAWLWAGDSRVYRFREGSLVRLSHDHADTDETYGGRAVTRAVGAPGMLEIEVERGPAQAGDRYLLCTDGLWGEVYAEQISLALSLGTPEAACSALHSTVAAGETPDNFTAVVVYVSTLAAHGG
jgi:type VI secretion system ImpM family protein